MILRRALAGAIIGLAVAAVAPVTAANAAAPAYPPRATVTINLSSSVVTVGATVTVTGSGFAHNITVSVVVGRRGGPQGFAGSQAGSAMGSLRAVGSAPAVQRLAASSALAGVATDNSGSFSTTLTFNQVGVFDVTASGQAEDGTAASASGTVTVLAVGGAGGPGAGNGGGGTGGGTGTGSGGGNASGVGGLPNTGASVGLPLTVGAILVLLGAGLVTVFRRRRGNATA